MVLRAGGNLVLCSLTKRVQDLLVITKLMAISEVYGSVADAIQRFQSGTFEIACPVCTPRQWLNYPGGAGAATCPACDVAFDFPGALLADGTRDRSESDSIWTVMVRGLSWPTYASEGEAVLLDPGEPTIVTLRGRLDLFTFAVAEAAWRVVPLSYPVLVDTTPVSASSPVAWGKLRELCGSQDGDPRTIVLATGTAAWTGATISLDRDGAVAQLRSRGRGPFRLTTAVRKKPG
jgi:hypothetical protein